MKKIIYLFLIAIVLLSSCLRKNSYKDYYELENDAIECVKVFLQAVYENREELGCNDCCGDDPFTLAKIYNPHWDPSLIEFDTTYVYSDKLHAVVNIKYKGHLASFRVYFPPEKCGAQVVKNYNHYADFRLNQYKEKYGFTILSNLDDFSLARKGLGRFDEYDEFLKVAEIVNRYLNSIKSGKNGIKYYPSTKKWSEDAFSFIHADSTIYKTSIDSIINKDKEYKVSCNNGTIFYIYSDQIEKEQIKSSSGLYPYEEMINKLNEQYDVEFVPEVPRPKFDRLCVDEIKKIRDRIKEMQEEAELEKNRRERRAYWENVGLVINNVKMTSGKDEDGDKVKGIYIKLFNPTQESIKYVIIEVTAVNAVGDKMSYPRRCRGIGPINPEESCEYSFDDIFVDKNNIIDDLSVGIQVVFMNGRSKQIRLKDALTSNHLWSPLWW